MGSEAVGYYLENARDYLDVAAQILERTEHPEASVFYSALSVECAAIAFLMSLGLGYSKRHRNWLVLSRFSGTAPEEMRGDLKTLATILKELEPHVIRRYPFTERGKEFIPHKYYSKKTAEEFLSKARSFLKLTEKRIKH